MEANRTIGRTDGATPTSNIGPDVMQGLAPAEVSDVLPLVPGVFVKQYGGLGGLRTVSLRGGSAAQTVVLLEGVRLSSAQHGAVDLSMIPARMVESITVHRGSMSALYGANAINGAVDIQLVRPRETTASMAASLGSFLEQRWTPMVALGSESASVVAALDVASTRGSYPFEAIIDGSSDDVLRLNSDARSTTGAVVARTGASSVFAFARTANRGVPGPVANGAAPLARARLADADVILGLRHTVATIGETQWDVLAGMRYLDQRFSDPDATVMGPRGIDERYLQRDGALSVLTSTTLDGMAIRSRMDLSFADLRGAMLQPEVGPLVQRRSASLAADATVILDSALTALMALRADVISDAGTAVTPLVAVRYGVARPLTLRASWSMGFRPASFNELYYLNYGTADLKPERSSTIQAGVQAEFPWGVQAEVDVYHQSTTNMIVSVPTGPVTTSARNVAMAHAVGVEAGVTVVLPWKGIVASASYTRQSITDQSDRPGIDGTAIPYSPPELFSAALAWQNEFFSTAAQWSYTSFRYAQPGAEFTSLLRPFSLANVSVGAHGAIGALQAHVRLQCDNLFDERYAVVRGFPMPGRMIRIRLDSSWNPTNQ